MRKQFSKLLPFLAIAGGIFICSCGDTNTPEGIQSRQKGEDCDQEYLCLSGLICEAGKCRVLCSTKDDCDPKEHCENNRCVANLSNACPSGFTGDLCDQCLPDHWGKECAPCNCSGHGTCNAGLSGNGSCSCAAGWDGPNCSTASSCPAGFGGLDGKDCNSCLKGFYGDLCEPCDCQNGECWDGKSGNGQCKTGTCAAGWDGPNCDKCAGDLSGAHCDLPKTCKNGTANLGLNGDGHCASCDGEWSGTDCDITNSCVNGTPNIGVTGNGYCSQCQEGWANDSCTECAVEHYGKNCEKYGYMKDKSGKQYRTVKIGEQEWMAENMAYAENVICYTNEKVENFKILYGCLYTWEDAIMKVCPSGWYIPSKADFDELLTYVDNNKSSSSTSFLSLIANSAAWKDYSNQGLDEFGFGALPAGYYLSGDYVNFGFRGYWWSATGLNSSPPFNLYLGDGLAYVYNGSETLGFSVRCLKYSN